MKHNLHVVAIIPAKTDSTRLPKKNLQVIDGNTLLEHSIDYAINSEYIKDIVVSTESNIVKNFVETKGYSPSYQEMLEHMNLNSKQGIYDYLQSLLRQGKIKQTKYMARSVEVI